jgi:SAM-dependent methyltransferase
MSRETSLSFDRVADVYDGTRGGADRVARFAERLVTHLPPDGLVLDIGAGTGLLTAAVNERRGHVFGVDIAARMLALAATRLPDRLVRGDAARLPFQDDTFAAAYSVWVLQNVADPATVFASAARVLAAGGRLIVMTTNRYWRHDDISEIVDPVLERLRPHRPIRDDPVNLERLAAGAGLLLQRLDWVVDEFMGNSSRQEADRMETKSTAVLWELNEGEWVEAIVPLLARLSALPDPDRPRHVRAENAVMVFARADK